jgi:heptosyltransferase-2
MIVIRPRHFLHPVRSAKSGYWHLRSGYRGIKFRCFSEGIASPANIKRFATTVLYGGVQDRRPDICLRDARGILVVRLDGIGDLVLMSPFLRELRRSNISAWITLVVDARFVNLVELCPYVNEILTFNPQYEGGEGPELHWPAVRLAYQHLWKKQFELALLPRWDIDYYHSASVAYLSGAADRVGYSEQVSPLKAKRNHGVDALLTWAIDDRAIKHEAERNLDFLRSLGGTAGDESLELWLSDQDREVARQALASRGVSGECLVGMHPGAGHPKRLWPLDRFVEVGRFLRRELGATVLIVGGPEDRAIAERLEQSLDGAAVNLAGELTIRQTAALLEHARLMIANDSGPMHLAVAASIPVVEISCHPIAGDPGHANSPVRFGPWTKERVVLQPSTNADPCSGACEREEAHCILGVSSEAVKAASVRLLTSALGSNHRTQKCMNALVSG